MDSFDIKVEKRSATLRHKRLEKMTVFFRFLEVCIFLFIISRISTQLPLDFKVSGDCIQGLLITISTPGFLFILGNAIVLVLFFNSGSAQVSAQQTNDVDHSSTEFCDEYVRSSGKTMDVDHVDEDDKKQGKEKEALLEFSSFEDRKMRRSGSENSRNQKQNSCRKLRRTVTENGRNVENYSERSVEGLVQKTSDLQVSQQTFDLKCYAADQMSGDEFRRRVEDFIARQQRSMRE